jgi:hypothetical protein
VYLTNVYDLRTGTLIWSGEGRTRETLAAFFDFFGSERTANPQSSGNPSGPGLADLNFLQLLPQQGNPIGLPVHPAIATHLIPL